MRGVLVVVAALPSALCQVAGKANDICQTMCAKQPTPSPSPIAIAQGATQVECAPDAPRDVNNCEMWQRWRLTERQHKKKPNKLK